ncbi:MAG: class I SAM-dependent methyltransferase [Acidobacteria bacterium]|nr:class I SAM-dependent methyltransferase [Acidobacteriota bacterium]
MSTAHLDKQQRPDGHEERHLTDPSSPWWGVHAARYHFAAAYVDGCRVLDVACGSGYGLSILQARANMVIGVDIDLQTVINVRAGLPRGSSEVIVADGLNLPFEDKSFDAIISFETVEHLEQRAGFLAELRRLLAPKGTCIISTPNANHTLPVNGKPQNPYHVYEYTPQELHLELSNHFPDVTMLGQVLDKRFVIPPFWDEQERLSGQGRMRAHVLFWRALNKLPFASVRDRVSRALWGQPFLPQEADYHFKETDVEMAPVLVALCRQDSSPA